MTRSSRPRLLLLAAAATGLVMILASCGSTKSTAARTATGVPPTTVPAAVVTANNPKLGAVLTDPAGLTLYHNVQEVGGKIACTGSCTTIWPPLLVSTGSPPPAAGPGMTGRLATIARPDGTSQLSYNGMPLYRFAQDHGPGDTSGQGIAGIWFVVSPTTTSASTGATTTMATPNPATTSAPSGATPSATQVPSAPIKTTPTSPSPTAPRPTSPPPTSPRPTSPPPTSPPPTSPPPTTCLYPPCY